MAAIFTPGANLAAKLVLIGGVAAGAGGLGWWWLWPRTNYARRVGFPVEQPVPFSHEHHVAGLGIDCRFCHAAVESSAAAGLPPTYTCMTCHSQVWTNAAVLAPVRQSFARHRPIAWQRVTDLPDYVYFHHAIHIAKGVGCEECHGRIDRMALTAKARPMTMGFCLDCHRDPGPRLRPRAAVTEMGWRRGPATPPAQALLAAYHIGARRLTDCSICHR
ncbi:Molybdopterin oxidoreductase subunit, predicted; chaperone protein HtpG [Rhodovastum atsumiense]|uniref:Cytochrome c3 family protein n=1 Tax=Rhodovastum atsumiense TaxID=504468 RepID=A0A5M6IZ59_9PROT|nr:cytochrome c3 family protein [Rhodovastum atsumiense]KAA5613239.1 cytochrome c3 family protein [Rhodovastum atsumiense]CAH2600604.1 Molybdopterin oxidoreductase subunit, predicted; chaperone protein HtpG [Rhodovastum atsumiense]